MNALPDEEMAELTRINDERIAMLLRAIYEPGRGLTPDEQRRYDQIVARMNELCPRVTDADRERLAGMNEAAKRWDREVARLCDRFGIEPPAR